MYDYGLSILEQYGLNADSSARTRGALLCRTEKGMVIIREFGGTEKKLQKQQELLAELSEQGCLVDRYLSNQEGMLVTRDRDGIPYTVQQWYEGRECDTRSREDIFRSVCMLAQIHEKMQLPVVEFYVKPSLEDEYQRHNQELKKIRSFIRKKGAVCSFEKLYLDTVEKFLMDGEHALTELKASDYTKLRKEAVEQGLISHGEYNQHNVLMLKPGTAVTNFEHWGFDMQISDLYRFMRKILEKYGWDVRIGMDMLRAYHQKKPITISEWENLRIRFSYPEKYWKLANYYYVHKKTLVSRKNTEKMQNLVRQKESQKYFIGKCFGSYPF